MKTQAIIGTLGTVLGIAVGILTCWSIMRGETRRMKTEMETEIRDRVMIETRLSRLEAQAEQNKSATWEVSQRVNAMSNP